MAQLHALEAQTANVEYREVSAEALAAEQPGGFDVVTCMEMLEHVPDPASVVRACATLVKPGGWVFFSTLNRNPKSFLFAIVGAEYVLNLLPRGTHEYLKFIRPSELAGYLPGGRPEPGPDPRHGIQPVHAALLAVVRHRRQLPVRDPESLMFSKAQAVLFDLDGTLIDSAPDLGAAADKMRVERGLPSLAARALPSDGRRGRARHAGRGFRHHARASAISRPCARSSSAITRAA